MEIDSITTALLHCTLRMLIAAALAAAVLRLLRVRSPGLHRWACVIVLLAGWPLLPLRVEVPVLSAADDAIGDRIVESHVDPGGETLPARTGLRDSAESLAARSHDETHYYAVTPITKTTIFRRWFIIAWAAGLTAVLAASCWRYVRFARNVSLGDAPDRRDWIEEWEAARRQWSVDQSVALRITRAAGPLLCFVSFAYFILAPRSLWSRLTARERSAVLDHELAHLARRDLWWSLLVRLLALPQWFNPVAWLAVRRFEEAAEWACDDLVQGRHAEEPFVYPRALVRLGELVTRPPAHVMAARGGVLSRRVERLMGSHFKEDGKMKKWIVVAALLALVCFNAVRVELVARESEPVDEKPAASAEQPEQASDPPSGDTPVLDAADLRSVSLQPYVIEPPDILLIDAVRVVPKSPFRIQPGDVVHVAWMREPINRIAPIGTNFSVQPGGKIDLGTHCGSVQIAGLSLEEAAAAIKQKLSQSGINSSSQLVVRLAQSAAEQQIQGETLVGPEGSIRLGKYGSVSVSGLTLAAAKTAIEEHLSKFFDNPELTLDVFAYNSKVCYVIVEGDGVKGDQVTVLPVTGNETVLDAIATADGVPPQDGTSRMWLARPSHDGSGGDQILPVDWQAISSGADTRSNYQLLPGDRLFVSPKSTFSRRENENQQPMRTNPSSAVGYQKAQDADSRSLGAEELIQWEQELLEPVNAAKRTISNVATHENRLTAAKQQLEAVQSQYAKGHVTLDLLLDAQRHLVAAETAYIEALVDLKEPNTPLEKAENDRLLAKFHLKHNLTARDQALATWKQVRAQVARQTSGESEAEAQAREQYFLFRSQAEDALAEVLRADADFRRLKRQSEGGDDVKR